MTLRIKLENSDDIKTVVKMMATMQEEFVLNATPEGLHAKAMDPSHVAMINLDWPKESFAEYECPEEINLQIQSADLKKIVERADKSAELVITHLDDWLDLQFSDNKKYKIRLINTNDNDSPIPKIEYTAMLTLSANALDKIVGDIEVISDYLHIRIDESGQHYTGKSDSGDAEIDKNDEATGAGFGTYSLEYIKPIIKAAKDEIKCELADGKPLRLEIPLGTGRMHFYLAPRVDN